MTHTNYFKIGVFTFAGIFLFLAGLLAFGFAQSAFEEKLECVTYFNRSVQGLAADSAVKFRGFRVGRVASIALASLEDAHGQPVVRVSFEIDPQSLAGPGDALDLHEAREYLRRQTADGLRAVLSFQGITGLGFLDLDYQGEGRPDALSRSVRQRSGEPSDEDRPIYIPSGPGQIMEIGESVTALVKSLSDVDFSGISRDINSLVQTVEQAVAQLDTGRMSAEFTGALEEIRQAATDLGLLIVDVRGTVGGSSGGGLGRELESAVAQLRQTVKRLDQLLGSSQGNLPVTLDNLRVMSENFRELSELLKAQPSQAFFGEPPEKARPTLRSTGGRLRGPQ